MTPDDFDRFFEHHRKLFPIEQWLAKNFPMDGGEGQLQAWADLLADIDIKYAIAASSELHATGSGGIYSKHPHLIRKRAKELAHQSQRPVFADGQETVSCPHCEDSKLISVLHHTSYKMVREAKFDADNLKPPQRLKIVNNGMTVKCQCSPREHWATFDERKHIRLDPSAEFDSVFALICDQIAPARHTEFDELPF